MRLPDFLIIGEMKCGTTTLWDLLVQHPHVFETEAKELHYFGSYSYFGACGANWPATHEGYARHFEMAALDQRIGEATPNYLSDPLAPVRIAETLPDVRLLVILRDPVERAWSHYWHQVRRGWETLGFEAAIDAEAERLCESYDNHEKFSYITRGRYVEHLRRYEALFGREQMCVVLLDELKRSPQVVAERAWGHLGLDRPYPEVAKAKHHNRASYPKWPALDRLTRQSMRLAEAMGGPLVAGARWVGRQTRGWRTYSGTPRMDPAVRDRLNQMFAPHNAELAEWLGQPVGWGEADAPSSAPHETTIGRADASANA
ncbi:MAG: sulfotransferase domain-containing protein [Phycisphaeraceae bacterium]